MTVFECYERAVSFLPEVPNDNVELQKHMVNWCNMLLADTVSAENVYRQSEGEKTLTEPATVSDKNEVIPYNERLVTTAFPYGMARWIFRDNDEKDESTAYYNLYVMAVRSSATFETQVEDVY